MTNFLKKHINKNNLWWFLVLFFSMWATYATSSWTIWELFNFFAYESENGINVTDVYRLNWENIKDDTITSYEIKNWTIKWEDIWVWEIAGYHIIDWTITKELLNPTIAWELWKWKGNWDDIYYSTWSVWIWTDSPSTEFEVIWDITASWNIITNLPTLNSHVTTKEYVDNVVFAAELWGTNTSWGVTCYYTSSDICWWWFNQMPWKYTSSSRNSQYFNHNICCTKPVNEQITLWWKSLYAFSTNWNHYVITPSWCNDKTDNPTCIWKDFVQKTTANAINYCDNFIYDWYDDWFLPNKNEFILLYWHVSETINNNTYYKIIENTIKIPGFYETYNSSPNYFRCIREL